MDRYHIPALNDDDTRQFNFKGETFLLMKKVCAPWPDCGHVLYDGLLVASWSRNLNQTIRAAVRRGWKTARQYRRILESEFD